MLSKRVLVVAAEKSLQKRLVAGVMAAGGAVQVAANNDELPPRLECDLLLYALSGEGGKIDDAPYRLVLARLPDEARVCPILPTPSLPTLVTLLAHPRVGTVLCADNLSASDVSATVTRTLFGDLFGVDKAMPWGVRVYSLVVGGYQEKAMAIATVSDFAHAMGVRRKYRDLIEQCCDELLMNALYDAPVDADGRPRYAEVSARDRTTLELDDKAVVQYACDGARFCLTVRDNFGSLDKATVLSYLEKCLHAGAGEQIDRKASGAGLGLFLIANAATHLGFHIFRAQATEVLCVFDLTAPASQLRALSVFEEQRSALGDARRGVPGDGGPRRGRRREDLLPAAPRTSPVLFTLAAAAVLLLVTSVALLAWPYLRHRATATLAVQSDPPGATLFVDGRARGSAPVTLTDLEAGRSYALRATYPSRRDDEQLVTAGAGETTVRLRTALMPASVRVESQPAGAAIAIDGRESGKLTPASVDLGPTATATLTLSKPGFADEKLVVTATPGAERVYTARLAVAADVAVLALDVEPATASVVVDGLALMPAAPHHETMVAPDAVHQLRVSATGFVATQQALTLRGGERRSLGVHLERGAPLEVRCNLAASVYVDDKLLSTTCATVTAPLGRHQLSLRCDQPWLRHTLAVDVTAEPAAPVRVDFGLVDITAPNVVALVDDGSARRRPVRRLALPTGQRQLHLLNRATNETKNLTLPITDKKTTLTTF